MSQIRIFLLVVLIGVSASLTAQENINKYETISISGGLGMNDGNRETGMGILTTVSYKRGIWKEDRLRLGAGFLYGGFMPIMITDTRDQFYRMSSLSINAELDAIRLGNLSLAVYGGGFLSYSRGLLGTGGWPEAGNTSSEYFLSGYYGISFGGGLRYLNHSKRYGVELYPFNFQFGPNYYMTANFSIAVIINLSKE